MTRKMWLIIVSAAQAALEAIGIILRGRKG
jgi:hypothetical protein